MKHLFIINPAAGKCDQTDWFSSAIETAFSRRDLPFEIAISKCPGDCKAIARAACETAQPLRIYACGGDGTLNEVVNGATGYPNVAVTHFPGGSGNDFIKIFSDPSAFTNLERLIDGADAEFDLIQVGDDHYAVNICSMGIDARIGTEISKYKRLPLVSGHGAYLLSTLVNVVKGIHSPYVIEFQDGECIDSRLSLVCIANGRWYGGGFHPVPEAKPDDGLLDVLYVSALSRLKLAKVIGKYKAGCYREFPEIIFHRRCRSLRVRTPKAGAINLDGELLSESDVIFRIADHKIRFFYPEGLTWNCESEVLSSMNA